MHELTLLPAVMAQPSTIYFSPFTSLTSSPSEPEPKTDICELVTASPGAQSGLLAGQIETLANQVNYLTPCRGDLPLNFKVWTSYGRREFDPESTQFQA